MTTRSVTTTNKFGAICRICLKEDGPMSSIFAQSETESDYQPILAARITSIAQVQISLSDGLPVWICQSCHEQVDSFYDFRLLVEISDRTLRSCFDAEQGNQRVTIQSVEDAKDLDYQEYLMETTSSDDSKDLFAVNTILVPSNNGTQVWRICSMDGGDEGIREDSQAAKENSNCEIDDFEGVKQCLAEKVQPVAVIKNVQDKEMLYFTTTTSTINYPEKSSADSDQVTRITIVGDDNVEDQEERSLRLDKYSCQLCLKSFKTLKILKGHVKDHFLGGKEKIQICEMKKKNGRFSSSTDPNSKLIEKQIYECSEMRDLDTLACHSCDQAFETNQEKFQAREKNGKGQSLRPKGVEARAGKKHSCDECGTEFAQKSKLRYHKGTHTNSSLTCTTCDKQFRNSQSFKMHLKRHSLGSRFSCRECGKRYYSNSELARHAQLHTGTRQYPCQLCDMSFFSKPELNRHCKYHNGDKKFVCNICFKTYYESGHLKVHQRVHTGEKPFPCTICEKAFITKSKLVRHFKIHERDRAAGDLETNIGELYRFVKQH